MLPEKGLSALDAAGQKFYDPSANYALFKAFEKHFAKSATRQLIRVPHHINDAPFVEVVEKHVREIVPNP